MICNKMRHRVKRLLQRFDEYVDAHAETALMITGMLQKALESPVADIITALIPGTADDLLRQQLLTALGHATRALIAAEQCAGTGSAEEVIRCFAAKLKDCPPEKRDALLQKLASLLTSELDGKRLKQNLYDLYTQAKYALTKA